ncbi:autophagy-related protein 22-like protein [Jimgerdemannia flammicorona]|nr:autophagy-related protein 22-like protein [Jimgerdemannia flammicorona]
MEPDTSFLDQNSDESAGGPEPEPVVTPKELLAWYSYAFASEVFAVVSLTTFIPITLEQLARDNGFLLPDKTIPCSQTNNVTAPLFAPSPLFDEGRCVVYFLGHWIDTASFSLYVFSFSVIIQALTVISMGPGADHGSYRKILLLTFALLGSISTLLFTVVTPDIFWLGGILAVIGNVSFGASIVCINGYLPLLVRNHWEVRRIVQEIRERRSVAADDINRRSILTSSASPTTERTPLLLTPAPNTDPTLLILAHNLHVTTDRVATSVSANGMAIGYLGGILLLMVCLGIVSFMGETTFSLQVGISLSGAWWLLLSAVAARWLLPRPGPPLPADEGGYVTYAWKKLGKTVIKARELKNTFWFLVAWVMLSDGYTTITSTALLFAKTALHIPKTDLILIALITPTFAIIGALIFPGLQRSFGLTTKGTIVLLLCLMLFIPAYGCAGFLPLFKDLGWGGLTDPREL